MSFDTVREFLYMGGHYVEVWLSYGLGFVVLTTIVVRPIVARRRFFAEERRRTERTAFKPSTGDDSAPTTP